jgi:Tol biopolymer transport system component
MTRSTGLMVWSPTGDRYLLNKRDAAGTYQIYVGATGSDNPNCITCSERPNAPGVKRHKLMGRWHPSGKWIVLAAERDEYTKPLIHTKSMIEGWILSGIFTNIYATRPDGSEWHRLSDFGSGKHADGFTGVPFTSDGKRAVWAQIVDGNIFKNLFGRWELIIADFVEDRNGVPSFTNLKNITPAGANWVEPGSFAPDNRSLVITADIGMKDPQGQDQYILDTVTGSIRNLTNTPGVWDEHGVFSPDGEKIFFMSSYPFRNQRFRHSVLFLRTEFMLINKDGTGLQQVTHYNSPGYPEYEKRGGLAANGDWHPDGRSISAQTLFLPNTEPWTITFKGPCGNRKGVGIR